MKDINPGTVQRNTLPPFPRHLWYSTIHYILLPMMDISNGEIWKTDGTTEGTEKVTNFLNYNVSKLTLVGDNFYFLIQKNDSFQVWISDGSEVGAKIR